MKTLVRYGYVPFMLLAINGAGIAIAASGGPKLWLLALLLLAIAASFAAERVLPYREDWNTPHEGAAGCGRGAPGESGRPVSRRHHLPVRGGATTPD
jgi:hypothetical protein